VSTQEIIATGTEQKRALADGLLPPTEMIRDGVWSIPLPLPYNPLGYVLTYLFVLADGGLALVDAGWDNDESWTALCAGLETAGFAPSDLRWVYLTHVHRDHYGQVGRIRRASDARVGMHPADARVVAARYAAPSRWMDDVTRLIGSHGVPEGGQEALVASVRPTSAAIWDRQPDLLINDRDLLPTAVGNLQAVWTPGHSPGHLCFLDLQTRALLAGDHLLPRVSPNISIYTREDGNPLADYLSSLRKVGEISVTEVLPGHEYRFRRSALRAAQLIDHHERRCRELTEVVRNEPGGTCWEIAQRLSWSRPWQAFSGFERRAALGETLAHLEYLRSGRTLVKSDQPQPRWSPAAPAWKTIARDE
jgi:glyoxylase-like metal-dependent hydrolase (beta-lactamase superfamily II)